MRALHPPRVVVGAALAAIALGLGSATARADVGPPALREPGVYLSLGGGTAVSLGGGEVGATVGGEASVVTLNIVDEVVWLGGYVDGLWDSRVDGARFSVGPEMGWAIFGLDGGYLLSVDRDGTRHGFTLRAVATVGFAAVYVRVNQLLGANAETAGEIGLLLKYPIALRGPAIDL